MSALAAGQTAVVTGASGGIGAAMAAALVGRGVGVHLLGRDAGRLEAVRHELERAGGVVTTHCCDFTDGDALRGACVRLGRILDSLDVLVHCAATIAPGRLELATAEDADRQWHVNVRAPLLLTRSLLPALRRARGQIVFVNSSVGVRCREGVGLYAATKHALKAIADTLRMEINGDGIRVLSIYPGNTATAMQRTLEAHFGGSRDPATLLQPQDVAASILGALDLPRTAEVTDIHVRPLSPPSSPDSP